MTTTFADRLAQVANTSTLRLTHYGRRSGMSYKVTIWFMVEGETVYLATANRKRHWPGNVAVRGDVPQAGLAAVPGNSHHTEL